MIQLQSKSNLKELYKIDDYLWLEETVKLLKQQKFNELDLENLIEELEALGISQKRELKNRLRVLIMHLLKYQSQKISRSWLSTIIEQRRQIEELLEFNPSLKAYLEEILAECYQKARKDGSQETGLSLNKFPLDNPFSLAQILDLDYLP